MLKEQRKNNGLLQCEYSGLNFNFFILNNVPYNGIVCIETLKSLNLGMKTQKGRFVIGRQPEEKGYKSQDEAEMLYRCLTVKQGGEADSPNSTTIERWSEPILKTQVGRFRKGTHNPSTAQKSDSTFEA